jgi:hypothetical protein
MVVCRAKAAHSLYLISKFPLSPRVRIFGERRQGPRRPAQKVGTSERKKGRRRMVVVLRQTKRESAHAVGALKKGVKKCARRACNAIKVVALARSFLLSA